MIASSKADKQFARANKVRLFWRQRHLQLFALLGVVYLLIFNYVPMVGILMAFKKYKISASHVSLPVHGLVSNILRSL